MCVVQTLRESRTDAPHMFLPMFSHVSYTVKFLPRTEANLLPKQFPIHCFTLRLVHEITECVQNLGLPDDGNMSACITSLNLLSHTGTESYFLVSSSLIQEAEWSWSSLCKVKNDCRYSSSESNFSVAKKAMQLRRLHLQGFPRMALRAVGGSTPDAGRDGWEESRLRFAPWWTGGGGSGINGPSQSLSESTATSPSGIVCYLGL